MRAASLLRHSEWDGLLVALAVLHGVLLLMIPSVPLVAIGLWWSANTVSHNFIHLPFFASSRANQLFSAYLSLVLGVPQSVWRARHLAHHAESARSPAADRRPMGWRWTPAMRVETALVASLWIVIATAAPEIFIQVYLPGWTMGLVLCFLQGHFEHARGTTSHYGRVYNTLFFNDGFHVEHHHRPALHWKKLGLRGRQDDRSSRWPPVLRWLEPVHTTCVVLDGLERLVVNSPLLQRLVLAPHERALRTLLADVPPIRSVRVIGGGLFPRTALILRRLLPDAAITVVDANASHLTRARILLGDTVAYDHALFTPVDRTDADMIVIPLAFLGDRGAIYAHPPAPLVVVHDWIWRRRGRGVPVSRWLLKRVNAVGAHVC
ncbi:MAG: fatty acid desaturase [Vicinamibacterales bacterium]